MTEIADKLKEVVMYLLPGEPQALKRHRTGKYGNTYDPSSNDKKTVSYELLSQRNAKKHKIIDAIPIRVEIEAAYEIPKSLSEKKKLGKLDTYKQSSPDIDNIAKFYLDAMNGVIFSDDRFVSELVVRKVYDKVSYVVIRITSKEGEKYKYLG